MKALTARVDTLENSAKIAAHNTQEILDLMRHAKTWSGYVRKWGPRIATLVVGIAVGRGWITSENGANFLHVFGI